MKKIKLDSNREGDVNYLYLPNHPGKGKTGVVKEQKRLFDLIKDYKGPDIYLDFNEEGVLIGIELLS